jgi:hypothetical protein
LARRDVLAPAAFLHHQLDQERSAVVCIVSYHAPQEEDNLLHLLSATEEEQPDLANGTDGMRQLPHQQRHRRRCLLGLAGVDVLRQ